jgi:NADH-quinone oxidoreductase subunit F
MSVRTNRILALSITAFSGLLVAGSAGLLVADYVRTLRHAPREKAKLTEFEQATKSNPSRAAVLETERHRQMKVSVDRDRRNTHVAHFLLGAAGTFLIAAKWHRSLNKRRPPDLLTVLTVRGVPLPASSRPSSPRPVRRESTEAAVDLAAVESIVAHHGRDREAIIPILQELQGHYHYLPAPALQRVCDSTDITLAQIAGVASFYKHFRRTPTGKRLIKVCHGTACHVAGAERISTELRRHLGIADGSDTDPDRQYTIEPVACMGCCTLAPVAQIDGVTRGHLTAESLVEAVARKTTNDAKSQPARAIGSHAESATINGDRPEIRIGLGSCCVAGGSGDVFEAMRRELAAVGVDAHVKRVGCVGMCHNTPLVEAILPGHSPILYAAVRAEDVRRIVRRHFGRRWWRARNTVPHGKAGEATSTTRAIELRDPPVAAFLGPQKHIATEHSGHLDPVCLDDYLRHEGFTALENTVNYSTPDAVIEQIRNSGLRGRGGAGFPTAEKWARVRAADQSGSKYIICNGDEGDPGAFMDRMLMESFPFRIIEGLAVAAYAVGASEGYFYIREEYPLAVQRIRDAIRQCEARGYLGENICGSGFSLRLRIMQGAGAFICGEETALIASIEGQRGTPRLRPPYPADQGLWGSPTLVNNVETLAAVPWIVRHGPAEFASLGTATSKGTKVFALAGKVRRGGLIEVPMGVTIRQIVEDIGGGIKGTGPFFRDGPKGASHKMDLSPFPKFKAVQIGGPSGGCVPASLADTPVDFEALAGVGAIMGSGGLVVLDETDCMVDMARYFLSFTQDQSCGKCTYCRVGTRRMLDILERICEGKGHMDDLAVLEELARHVCAGSLCGLGRTAPNPVLTTLRYFRDEYEAHIHGECPAGRCKTLITYRVTDDCIGCTLCAQHCPAEAIAYRPYERHEIDTSRCTRCDICRTRCPERAIVIYTGETPAPQRTGAASQESGPAAEHRGEPCPA